MLVSIAADVVLLLGFGWIAVSPIPRESISVTNQHETQLYHAATLPFAIYLYLSVATGGLGLTTAFLRTAPLAALGGYALYAYLLQEPWSVIFSSLAGAPLGHLQNQTPNTPPYRDFMADSFTFYLITLWLLAGLYTEYVETPMFGTALPRMYKACAAFVKATAARIQGLSVQGGSAHGAEKKDGMV